MSENIDIAMQRIEEYCAVLERTAFAIPAPNDFTPRIVSLVIGIRNMAQLVRDENFATGAQWTEEQRTKLLPDTSPIDETSQSSP